MIEKLIIIWTNHKWLLVITFTPILLLDKSEEIQWMEFETRMRKTIKDLVAPVIERA